MNPYENHLHSHQDLKTPYEQTRASFVAIALERNERATPHIAQARDLKNKASAAKTALDLKKIPDIAKALITAAGISDKATNHIDEQGRQDAVNGLIEKYLEPAGNKFVEELVYRFLLTRGDTLGGAMRNIVGALAQRKFTRAMVASLNVAGTPFTWLPNTTPAVWQNPENSEPNAIESAKGLCWTKKDNVRTLMYNIKVPFLGATGNSVDMCLFNCASDTYNIKVITALTSYLALGELKGGADPAGADEHWKTANSALTRIREKFAASKLKPAIFFVGAAIEDAMAREIWDQLVRENLTNAANLTNDTHLSSLCSWISNL